MMGTGPSATVWSARDTRTGTTVAVKELHLPRDRDDPWLDVLLDRFEREVRSLGRLSDVPGICRVFEVGIDRSGIPWFVAEYMEGGPLSSHTGAVTRAGCRRLFEALAVVHGRDVVHGDISPGNILFDTSGMPVLADFGMAGLGLSSGGPTPDAVTPAYAAPERLRGGPATTAADVHALAASLLGHVAGTDTSLRAVLRTAMAPLARERPSAERVARRLGRNALGSRP